jgi:Uma2 family endonuclease
MSLTVRELTYEDLKQMPQDGNRYEIIDGEPIVSPAPSLIHAEIVARLFLLIRGFVIGGGIGKHVFTAPVDVRLTGVRIVEPDIVYVSPARSEILADPALIDGAPDLIVEVLSPSNRTYDEQVKYRLYAEAGVREYWLVDPERETLAIFALGGDGYALVPHDPEHARSVILPGLEIDVAPLFADLI